MIVDWLGVWLVDENMLLLVVVVFLKILSELLFDELVLVKMLLLVPP